MNKGNAAYRNRIGLHCLLLFSLALSTVLCAQPKKINGVSFVGSPEAINASHIVPVTEIHSNWAAVMPFGFVKALSNPNLVFNIERQWWGEREEGVRKTITLLNEKDIQVMLKPQLWVWHGAFTGDIMMNSEADWKTFETEYEKFILCYAKIAQELHVPLLCIGTELSGFFKSRPQFWMHLIEKVRAIYTGKLTYAANWDSYMGFPEWCVLDYIGIDAYFPISESETPSITEIKTGWISHKKTLENFRAEIGIPLLFTEFGYRSVNYAGKKPWEASRSSNNINHNAQGQLLDGLFETFWAEPWFAGGFLWKWYHDHEQSGGLEDNRFTIQNKPAAAIVKKWYRHEE